MDIKRRMQIINRRLKAEGRSKSKEDRLREQAYAKLHTIETERDRQVIDELISRGCMDVGSLKRNFWNDQKDAAVKASLDRLVKTGAIKAATVGKMQETVYFVGKRPAYSEAPHMVAMSRVLDEIKFRSGYQITDFASDHQLKREVALSSTKQSDAQIPDGRLVLQDQTSNQMIVHCEIDSINYCGERLFTKASGISTYVGNGTCIWVCSSAKRLDTVSNAIRDFANIRPVLFSQVHAL